MSSESIVHGDPSSALTSVSGDPFERVRNNQNATSQNEIHCCDECAIKLPLTLPRDMFSAPDVYTIGTTSELQF